MVETKRELRVKRGISGESPKKAAIPFRIAASIYGTEGRTRQKNNDINKLSWLLTILMLWLLVHEINKHLIVEAGVHIPRTFG